MISKSDKKQIFRLYGELLRSNHDKPGTQIESWVVWKTQLTQKLKVDNKERRTMPSVGGHRVPL